MLSNKVDSVLRDLGVRLRRARIARNDAQAVFARRLGISVPTLRAMEQGKPTAQIGHWIEALAVLGRLDDLEDVLADRRGLIEQARAARKPARKRVSPRRTA